MPRPLGQTAVWGAAILLCGVGLISWEYWGTSGWFDFWRNNDFEAAKESSSVLSKASRSPNQGTQETKTKELYENFLAQKQALSPKIRLSPVKPITNPAAPPTDKIVETPLLVQAKSQVRVKPDAALPFQPLSGQTSDFSSGVNPYTASSQPLTRKPSGFSLNNQFPYSTNQNQSVVPISPVQPVVNQAPVEPQNQQIDSLRQPLPTSALPSQTLPSPNKSDTGAGYNPPAVTNATPAPNSYNFSVEPQQVPSSATYSAPIAPRNIAPYSNQVPGQATKTDTNSSRLNSSFQNSGGLQPSQIQHTNSRIPYHLPEP